MVMFPYWRISTSIMIIILIVCGKLCCVIIGKWFAFDCGRFGEGARLLLRKTSRHRSSVPGEWRHGVATCQTNHGDSLRHRGNAMPHLRRNWHTCFYFDGKLNWMTTVWGIVFVGRVCAARGGSRQRRLRRRAGRVLRASDHWIESKQHKAPENNSSDRKTCTQHVDDRPIKIRARSFFLVIVSHRHSH